MADPGEKDGSVTLYCFTPLVTLLTFLIELVLSLYVIIRYRLTAFGRLTALVLLLLGLFQVAEYAICSGMQAETWAKIAFLSITFLPVIGLHLIALATGRRLWYRIGYAIGAVFLAIILFSRSYFIGTACPGKYVIFNVATDFSNAYTVYYLGFLAVGIMTLAHHLRPGKGNRPLLAWLLIGYASFILPAFFLYVLVESTRPGFTSILCGFALIFAAILVGKVLPLYKKPPMA